MYSVLMVCKMPRPARIAPSCTRGRYELLSAPLGSLILTNLAKLRQSPDCIISLSTSFFPVHGSPRFYRGQICTNWVAVAWARP